jgi:hypothetical protein
VPVNDAAEAADGAEVGDTAGATEEEKTEAEVEASAPAGPRGTITHEQQSAALHHLETAVARLSGLVRSEPFFSAAAAAVRRLGPAPSTLVAREEGLGWRRLLAAAASHGAPAVEPALAACLAGDGGPAPLPPAVARGVGAWQSHRIGQAARLCTLQLALAAHTAAGTAATAAALLSTLLGALSALGQGMKRPAVVLAHVAVDAVFRLCQATAPADRPRPRLQLDRAVKNKVLHAILGSKEEAEQRVSFPELAVVLTPPPHGDAAADNRSSLAGWRHDCLDATLPVAPDWTFQCLFDLSGAPFAQWLCALAALGAPAVSDQAEGASVDDEVQTLYNVLRLASPENSHRWVDPDAHARSATADDDDTGDVDDVNNDDPWAPPPAAVHAFTHLLTAAARRAAHARTAQPQPQPQRGPLVAAFVAAAHREVAHALGSVGVRRVREHRGDLTRTAQASAYG